MPFRILFLGENWFGSCARACCFALRRIGHDVRDVDILETIPQARRRTLRGLVRMFKSEFVREYNDRILDLAVQFRPDMLIAFKGTHVTLDTLVSLRRAGVAVYNYYPDTSLTSHGIILSHSLPHYDCIFTTKHYHVGAEPSLKCMVFLPHGYDPEVHKPWDVSHRDAAQYGCDVAVIATHTLHKEHYISQLLHTAPSLDLKIWGHGWRERSRSSILRSRIVGDAVCGSAYAIAICAAKINLGIMSGQVKGTSYADDTTTRTYEIPACGGFMLHQRSAHLAQVFEEDAEVACFETVTELADKIRYYLDHPAERAAIAAAGHQRAVPQYSYDRRMAALVDWHARRSAETGLQTL
jgi:spore maturation protein CgeB